MSSTARKALLRIAEQFGYRWHRYGSHIVLQHRETGAMREVPYNVPEGRGASNWRNLVADLRRGAGKSTQGAEHVEGQRRAKRTPRKAQPKTRAARRAEILAAARSRAVERLGQLDAVRRLMR